MSSPTRYANYPQLADRAIVWSEVARYLRRDAQNVGTLLELGAGYCDFTNHFPAEHKIALDLNPEMAQFAEPEVDFRVQDATDLDAIAPESVDLVFSSNFLEHLHDDQLQRLLPSIQRVLKKGGKLMLIQPNFERCKEHYWDDETHVTLFSHLNIKSYIEPHGFTVRKLLPGLLPFSMKSRLPKWRMMIRMYLMSPIRPFGAQMYLLAERK